jgi:hypothetical protein
VTREDLQEVKQRYAFLFKTRILLTKVRKISEERSVFVLKDIIKVNIIIIIYCAKNCQPNASPTLNAYSFKPIFSYLSTRWNKLTITSSISEEITEFMFLKANRVMFRMSGRM